MFFYPIRNFFVCLRKPRGSNYIFFSFFFWWSICKNVFLLGLVFTRFQTSKTKTSQELYEKYFILLKRFILFLSSSNFLKMFFSSLCFTQTTLKTFLSTHIKKIHGNVLFPTERKKIPQPSQSLWKNITTTQLTTVRRETCFVSHWKKDFFFLFLSGFFFLFGTKWKKNHSVSLKEKNLVKSFFFHYFTLFQIKNIFFFSQSKKEEKNHCVFFTQLHIKKTEEWNICFIVSEMEKHCLFLHLWNQVKKCHHRKKKIINLVNFSFSHGNVFTWFLSWKTEVSCFSLDHKKKENFLTSPQGFCTFQNMNRQ